MLGLPHAFAECGYVLGCVLLTSAALCSGFGLYLLSASAKKVGGGGPSSFFKVTAATIPRWAFLVDVAIAIKCFGVGTSYLVVVGTLLRLLYTTPGISPHFCCRMSAIYYLLSSIFCPLFEHCLLPAFCSASHLLPRRRRRHAPWGDG
jgi:amino acid permease